MTRETHVEYSNIVPGDSRAEKGMPDFVDTLDKEEIESIRVFLVTQANRIRNWQESRRKVE